MFINNLFIRFFNLLFLIFLVGFFTSCSNNLDVNTFSTNSDNENISVESKPLIQDTSFYQKNDANSVKYLYVTISGKNDNTKYTFSDLNKDTSANDDFMPEVKVIFQEGNKNGPVNGKYGYGITDANAEMRIRGSSTRNAEQKSYKITLNKKVNEWDGFSEINLNKHPYDYTRMRNKLSFDYFMKINNFSSLRTQFVNLYIKDLTKNTPDSRFVNYGLFTQIEQPDKNFLKVRKLDTSGNLYKTKFFEFLRYEDHIINSEDEDYNEDEFEEILEIKGGKDHTALINMLDDVNNEDLDINDVVQKHFNRDNYLTWLAVNLIMGNIDTNSQNFYLYKPGNSSTWYFMPWDYDGAWGYYNQFGQNSSRPTWQNGLSNYGGVVLHKRFFADKNNVNDLIKKVDKLRKIINKKDTQEMLKNYYNTIIEYVSVEPDKKVLLHKNELPVRVEMERIPEVIEKNIKNFNDSIKTPMPVFTGGPFNGEGSEKFISWNNSYCPNGQKVSYSVSLATDPEFKNIVDEVKDINGSLYYLKNIKPGKYYFKLNLKGEDGTTQTSFDRYKDENGKKYFGVKEVVIFR